MEYYIVIYSFVKQVLGTRRLVIPETENLSPNTKILIPFSLNF